MAITREAKIGVIGLVLFLGGLMLSNFLKQKNIFSANMIITAKFDRVDFVAPKQPVFLKGRQMGTVVSVYKVDNDYFVDLDIDPTTQIPKNTRASIFAISIMGGTGIALLYDRPCQSDCLQHGDQILGTLDGTQQQAERMAKPLLMKFDSITTKIFDDSLGVQVLLNSAYASIANLKKTTNSYKKTTYSTAKTFPQNMASLRAMTANLSSNFTTDAAQQSVLDSMLKTMSSLTQKDIDAMTEMLYKAAEVVPTINPMIDKAKAPIQKTNKQLDKLNKQLKTFGKGGSSKVAKMLHDADYKDSTKTKVKEMSAKLEDIKNNPQKYLSLKEEK